MYESNTENIKTQMAHTRSSLAEKLETLENKVVHSVETAGAAVEDTVDKVLGTVEHATATVGDTINKVSSTVGGAVDSLKDRMAATEETLKSTVHAVRERISLSCHVRKHPWLMMGGGVMAGYWLDHLLEPYGHHNSRESSSTRILSPARLTAESANSGRDEGTSPRQPSRASETPSRGTENTNGSAAWLSRVLGPHVTEIQGLADRPSPLARIRHDRCDIAERTMLP